MVGPRSSGRWYRWWLRSLAATAGLVLAAGPAQAAPTLPAPPRDPAMMVAQVGPAVVNIDTQMGYHSAVGAGTGIIIDPGGVVLTNNHVIAGATGIKVDAIGSGQSYDVDVLGYDRSHDVAVLQLRGAGNLPTANIGRSSGATIGEPVMAMGNAGGAGGAPTAVPGHITALNETVTASDALTGNSETLTNMIKSDTPIRPGDSGGPLVNAAGQVIGMNTAASENFQFGGDGYAIPIDQAMAIAGQIRARIPSGSVHIGDTGFLGVGVSDAPGGGAEVLQVLSGTPATDIGIGEHDVITAINGRPVNSANDLTSVLDQHHPGDGIALTWHGPGGERTANVTLGAGPAG